MSPKVSIIIPVYKTEQYLRECLESVLVQTYTDWECLLIDDGSPDDCGAICDEYVSRDSRFRVFHKENGGVSSARNVGLDNCVGEYVTFVDSDDTIAPDYLEAVNDFEGDLMILGYDCIDGGLTENLVDGAYLGQSYNELMAEYLNLVPMRTPWAKIFCHRLIGDIRFDTSIQLGEDTLFCLNYYSRCSSVMVLTQYRYNYRSFPYLKEYCRMPVGQIVDTVCKLYNCYKANGSRCKRFVVFLYYYYRSFVECSIVSLNTWFMNPTIKEMYVDNIHSSIMYKISHYRWIIQACLMGNFSRKSDC